MGMAGMGQQLNVVVSVVFSNLNSSMILSVGGQHKRDAPKLYTDTAASQMCQCDSTLMEIKHHPMTVVTQRVSLKVKRPWKKLKQTLNIHHKA